MSDRDLLLQIAQDIGAMKRAADTQAGQISELFKKVNGLCEYKAAQDGKEKGKADIIGRLMSAAALGASVLAAYISSGGKHP
jgi:hypothetical protein